MSDSSPQKRSNTANENTIEQTTLEANRTKNLSLVTPERLQKLDSIRGMKWVDRFFRKFDTGSLRGVVLMWVRMTLGIGILMLPFFVKQYGAIMGVMVLAVCAALNLLAFYFIFEASYATDKKSYPDLIEALLGNTILKIFRVSFILDIGSATLIYSIVSWNLLKYLIYLFEIGKEHWGSWLSNPDKIEFDENNSTIFKIRGFFFYGIFLVTIPLFLKRDLGSLQHISIGYLIALFFLLSVILIEVPFFRIAYRDEDIDFHWFKAPSFGWIECFFGMCIAYYVQPYVFSFREELLLPSVKRIKKISNISIGFEVVAFIVLGFLGYFALGDVYTPDLFILRKPYPSKNPITEHIFRAAITLFFVLNTLGLAMFNPALRDYLSDMVKMKNEKTKYILLSLGPFFITCTIAFLCPSVIELVNFFGYTVNNFNGYIIPVLMKIQVLKMQKARAWKIVLCYMLVVTLIVMGALGFIFRLLGWTQLD